MSRQEQTGLVDDLGPILDGPGASDYERYLRTDELLSLQKTPEERAHHDELLFQCDAPVVRALAEARRRGDGARDRARLRAARSRRRSACCDRSVLCFKLVTQRSTCSS